MSKEKEETFKKSPEPHRVWVGESDHIASFHEVDDYKLQSFYCHDTFINYLRTLQECGYRFQ